METTRVDQWVWAIRLYKTRADATDACKGGHVRVNGTSAKPATPVRIGDRVEARVHDTDRDRRGHRDHREASGSGRGRHLLHRPHARAGRGRPHPGGRARPRRRTPHQAGPPPDRPVARLTPTTPPSVRTHARMPVVGAHRRRGFCQGAAMSPPLDLRFVTSADRARAAARQSCRGGRRGPLERRQVVAHQRPGQPQRAGQHVEDARSHAAAQLLRAARRRHDGRLPRLRLRQGVEGPAGVVARDDRALPARPGAARRW